MKILHVTKKYPRALGGDATVVENLQKQQQDSGNEVVIVTSNCDEITDGKHIYKVGLKDTSAGLDTITIKRIISLVVLFFRMFSILHKERPAVIHTHSVDMAFSVSFAARLYNIPMIHTFHIVTFYNIDQSMLRRKSELWLAKKARLFRVTAPNIHDVKRLQEAGLDQAVLLPNGIDLEQWQTNDGKKSGKQRFIAVGRLEKQKGYDYLIKALPLLPNVESLEVTIVGEGSQKEALLKLAKSLNVAESVRFAGRKSPREIKELLAGSHVAVLSSLYETTPLTLLEAWATGVPTIATPVGILQNTSSNFDATLLVPLKDEQALAAAMYRLTEDERLRKAVADAGREEVKKYTWSSIAQSAEIMYRSAL